jgi:hypothetical protein
MRNRTLLWILVLAGALAAAWGCAKKHVSGPLGNQPPETWFLNNIPRQSDTLPDRALLFWTGKDPDGRIIAYEYVIDNTAGQWTYLTPDTAGTAQYIGNSLLKFGTPTQDTIQFTVPDLVGVHTLYVRAVDNLGQRDPSPASRAFTIKTVAPNTQILSGPVEGDTLFCLPAFTATWRGIAYSVNPSDTMDPDGRVTGWYYAVDETLPNRQTWRFTTNPACTLSNLADGQHLFAISAMDNADAVDPTPAIRHFTTYRPLFNQGILLVDETRNGTGQRGQPNDAQADSVYHIALQGAGRSWTDWDNSNGDNRPPKEVLRRYSTVIWHSDEIQGGPNQHFPQDSARFRDYLNVGGKLWLAGLKNLSALNGDVDPLNKSYAAGTFERNYLGLSAANTAKTNVAADSCFVGTWGVFSGYPDLATDSMKVLANQHGHLPYVNLLSTAGSEVLLSYKSSPLNPQFERLPCAVRYQGPTFKTVFFAFPCYQIKIDQNGYPLTQVFSQTLDFLGEH